MKRKAKLRCQRLAAEEEKRSEQRKRQRGQIVDEIDLVPVYRRNDMAPAEAERFGRKACYFDDWCVAQIGAPWKTMRDVMMSNGYNLMMIETYGESLAREFRLWAYGWGVQPRGMRLW